MRHWAKLNYRPHVLAMMAVLIGAFSLTACYQPIDGESEENSHKQSDKSSVLKVSLFSAPSLSTYPANLLVFDASGKRVKDYTLTETTPTATMQLNRGYYRLVALTGTSYYQLPSVFELESVISFADESLPQETLLLGEADITLASDMSVAQLQLSTQTASISFTTSQLPSTTRRVRVSLSRLYSELSLQGGFQGPRSYLLDCSCRNNRWFTEPVHLFPAHGTNTVVSIEIQRNDSNITLGYNVPFPLEAGHAYEMQYNPETGLSIDGTTVDPSATTSYVKADTIVLSSLPIAPALWDGHIIAYTENNADQECDMLLISINEWEDIHSSHYSTYPTEAADIAKTYQEGGTISGRLSHWSIPTKEEAYALRALYTGEKAQALNNVLYDASLPLWSLTDGSGENIRYLCNDGQHTFTLSAGSSSITKGGTKATYRLRLVKRIHVKLG